ncbi:MAG: hypothetical protein JW909_04240 [Planctomycetes bacterium]|nr:hypothetical protein [Planctomycetota bacterium]
MSKEKYWIGKGLDLEQLWQDYDDGQGYIQKVAGSELHLLRLTFANHPAHLPLFDHEAIYKTVKGTFHEVKAECLTREAYDRAAPIFLYRVDRGSGIFEFLAQFDPLMTWVVALGAAATWYRRALSDDQELDKRRLTFIRANFPNASASDVRAYMRAWTTFGRRRVLHRLIGQELHRVEVSKNPVDAKHLEQPQEMVDVGKLLE